MSFVSSYSGIIVVDSRNQSGTITLPSAIDVPGRTLIIKDEYLSFDKNPVSISTAGTDIFEDGTNVMTLSQSGGYATLVAASTVWYTIQTSKGLDQSFERLRVSTLFSDYASISSLTVSSINIVINVDSQFISTVEGLGSVGYLSSYSNAVFEPGLVSSLEGLGTLGFLSSQNYSNTIMVSTIEGLGTLGYLSSLGVSTLYVSSLKSYAFTMNGPSIAIGSNSGITNQGANSIALGFTSGESNQGTYAVAIGYYAGALNQNQTAVAIGYNAGVQYQGIDTIAIGSSAGSQNQLDNSVAIGLEAGRINQNSNAIAIGPGAGQSNQSENTVAIGYASGQLNQGSNSVALGFLAGYSNQGCNAIAIGYNAGASFQASESIILNASINELNASTNGFFVYPIRESESTTFKLLAYDSTNHEVVYISSSLFTDMELISTVEGLGTLGFLSTVTPSEVNRVDLVSTVEGLGTTGYLSSYLNVVFNSDLVSTVDGLGTMNYISSVSSFFAISSIFVSSLFAYELTVTGPSTLTVNGTSHLNTVTASTIDTLNTITANIISAPSVNTSSLVTSYVDFGLAESPSIQFFGCAQTNSSNVLIYSYDGINWSNITDSNLIPPKVVKKLNGKYFVGGFGTSNNTISYSIDGNTWTSAIETPVNGDILDIAYGNSTYVAVGYGSNATSTIQYSIDGSIWSNVTNNPFDTGIGNSVTFDTVTGLFVAVGDDKSATIKYSGDGITWSNATNGFDNYGISIDSYNGFFVATGADSSYLIKYSGDGINWSNATGATYFTARANCVKKAGAYWFVGGQDLNNSTIRYSIDGQTWSNAIEDTYEYNLLLNTFTYNGSFYMCGRSPDNILSSITYSIDGINWITSNQSFTTDVIGIVSLLYTSNTLNGGDRLTVNSGLIYINGIPYSSGGISPNNLVSSIEGLGTTGYISSFNAIDTFNNVYFIEQPINTSTVNYIVADTLRWSSNLSIFNDNILPNSNFNGDSIEYSLALNKWVVCARDTLDTNFVYWSDDGFNWSNVSTGGFGPYTSHLGVNSGGFAIRVNLEGPLGIMVGYQLNTYGYYATDESIQTTSNGIDWDSSVSGIPSLFQPWDVKYVSSGLYMAVGYSLTASNILYSIDGQNWSATYSPASYNLYNVAGNGSVYVAIGYPNDGITATSSIQYSTDLNTWNSVLTGGFDSMIDNTLLSPYYYELVPGAVGWNGSMFVATGNHSISSSCIQWSIDGSNWSSAVTAYGAGKEVKWRNGLWYITGETGIQTSADGKHWSLVSSEPAKSLGIYQRSTGVLNYNNNTLYLNGLPLNFSLDTSAYISNVSLTSTIIGLGSIGYISSATGGSIGPNDLVSTVEGLGTTGYLSSYSNAVFEAGLVSSLEGLGTLGFVSSQNYSNAIIVSTIEGLGSVGYLSSYSNAVFESGLVSSLEGLGTLGFLSSQNYSNAIIVSTIKGLGSVGYLSSYSNAVFEPSLVSSLKGLGTMGYISSLGVSTLYVSSLEAYAFTMNGPSIAIGSNSGITNQGYGSVAIGNNTGSQNQGSYTIAIGSGAGSQNQDVQSIAIGANAGNINQNVNAIAIGLLAGTSNQSSNAIGIGYSAGLLNQNLYAVAIGYGAGSQYQGIYTIAIGNGAGSQNQLDSSVAIGINAGNANQGCNAVAIGPGAGATTQGENSVAIGYSSAQTNQGSNSVALGFAAGNTNQGCNAVAIGAFAGLDLQVDNSIILNASGEPLNVSSLGFFVAPIRSTIDSTNLNVLLYNSTTHEIVYSETIPFPRLGNTLTVDSVNGNDISAVPGGLPYKTINAASSNLISGDTMWILPGTYELTSSIYMPSNTSLRGMSLQNVKLVLSNVSSATTMLTMGENCRVEDLQLYLHSLGHYNLIGIEFPGTTHYTSKLRTAVVTIDNSNASSNGSSECYSLHFTGSNNLGEQAFSFNSLKGSTVNLFSNGNGRKRGILISGNNVIVSTRDMNIYCSAPVSSNSAGSYVGIETSNATASIQLRATTISGPNSSGSYTGSDILQSLGSIEIGPGTDIVHKTAGTSTFTTYVYPAVIYYGIKGDLSNAGVTSGYLWPGSLTAQQAQAHVSAYPDNIISYYRVQQKSIMNSFTTYLTSGPQDSASTHITVQVNGVDTPFKITYNSNDSGFKVFSSASVDLKLGDLISMKLDLSSIGTNLSHDLTVQLDLF